MQTIVITTQSANGKGVRLSFPTRSLGLKPAIAMSPEITRETFEKGPGRQTSLFNIDDCVKNHARLRKEYNLTECPNCQRSIEKTPDTANKSEQKALSDF